MGLLEFAESELRAAGLFDPDADYDGMIGPAVLELIRLACDQGHSGFSAAYVTSLFNRLMNYEPLSPLTGEDIEWVEYADGQWQNTRAPNVFKDETGTYQSDYYLFEEPDGVRYTNRESRKPVKFPYVPSHEVVKVEKSARVASYGRDVIPTSDYRSWLGRF